MSEGHDSFHFILLTEVPVDTETELNFIERYIPVLQLFRWTGQTGLILVVERGQSPVLGLYAQGTVVLSHNGPFLGACVSRKGKNHSRYIRRTWFEVNWWYWVNYIIWPHIRTLPSHSWKWLWAIPLIPTDHAAKKRNRKNLKGERGPASVPGSFGTPSAGAWRKDLVLYQFKSISISSRLMRSQAGSSETTFSCTNVVRDISCTEAGGIWFLENFIFLYKRRSTESFNTYFLSQGGRIPPAFSIGTNMWAGVD